MADLNRVTLLGRLGADPETRTTAAGDAVANLSVATGERWRDRTTQEPRERTEWHRVSCFGRVAEIAGQYLRKGSRVYLEGNLRTRKWQDSSGADRYSTEVVLSGPAAKLILLDPRSDVTAGPAGAPANAIEANVRFQAPRAPQPQQQPQDFDDDIPF